jgi:hypothetical protein
MTMTGTDLIYAYSHWIYILTLIVVVVCLYRGHRQGHVNLWDMVTSTKGDKTFTDRRKFFETGAFVVSSVAFSYLVVVDKLNEIFLTLYITTWVGAAYLRDREQRLNKQIDNSHQLSMGDLEASATKEENQQALKITKEDNRAEEAK